MAHTRKSDNYIVTAVLIACVILVAGLIGDYYFDLNDDCLIKDILSGSYTGTPEGHNIQMLYPIGAVISLFYRVVRSVSWYGIFLCALQYGCFAMVLKRTSDVLKVTELCFFKKLIFLLLELGIMMGLFLPHLLYIQYTVTSGLLAATAAFLILSRIRGQGSPYMVPILLIGVAFMIRSEMLLLMLPTILVAILIKWVFVCFELDYGREAGGQAPDPAEKKTRFIRYLNLCIGIAAGLLLCIAMNKVAYSSNQWKEFVNFFDNRTELYDFQSIPDYGENKDFYDSIGLSESSQKLLENYNFGLDDSIDAAMVGEIADYAKSIRTTDAPLTTRLGNAARLYFYRLYHVSAPKGYEYPMTDYPWNLLVLVLYIIAFISCFVALRWDMVKVFKSLLLLGLLFACRTTLWMYILVRGRDPIRITHPLYLTEIFILIAMILALFRLYNICMHRTEKGVNSMLLGSVAVAAVLALIGTPFQASVVRNELSRREASLYRYEALNQYMKENSENYYLIDVYTSVSYATVTGRDEATYSEKMFGNVDNSGYNHDLMGGWASKSPLSRQKLRNRGFSSMEEALLSKGVYFVQNMDTDTDWIVDYYADKGQQVTVTRLEVIEDVFGIYQVREE